MGKHGKMAGWEEDAMKQSLQKAAEAEQIPESLHPIQMEAWLERATAQQEGSQQEAPAKPEGRQDIPGHGRLKKHSRKWWIGTAAAACLAVGLLAAGRFVDWKASLPGAGNKAAKDGMVARDSSSSASDYLKEGTTYKELYQSFCEIWSRQEKMSYGGERGAWDISGEPVMEEEVADIAAVDDTAPETALDQAYPSSGQPMESAEDYGKTNQQEEAVEEADIIKNDGRYLYRPVSMDYETGKETVQITDTQGGLKKAATVGEFSEGRIHEIYVWKDTLVIMETGWASTGSSAGDEAAMEDVAYEASGVPFSKIHIYDIKDRTRPKKYHEFTIKGNYKDSRIFGGYLYVFAGYDAYQPKIEMDYKAYIPELDDKPLASDKIYLPKEMESASYLVMASISMEQPDAFTDTKAIVSPADSFYVSKDSIYVTSPTHADPYQEGVVSDSTHIYRFSYQDGKMEKKAEGEVKGTLRDDFAINEYRGYLRMVTTVEEETVEKVVDDISGEEIGYNSVNFSTSNSLYVLDSDLKTVGKIEGIAENERIYSARFLGDTGYFVTFRQVDPLFSVDLSDPQEPKILGELKISGFSEYLHFYADNLLLGIGMEADEKTGVMNVIKLAMFDISNPADVKEQSSMSLKAYGYANALYNYKAVLIDPKKNLFGFCAESYKGDYACRYLLFSYENGEFKKRMELECTDLEMDDSASVRGTYIGDVLYLMYYSGRVEAYSLADGSKVGELLLPKEGEKEE